MSDVARDGMGHGLLAMASGILAGNVVASIPFGLIGGGAAKESFELPADGEPDPRPAPPSFSEFDSVEFVRMTLVNRWWAEGAEETARLPREGDRGVVVAANDDQRARVYIVEVFDDDANTICVAEALGEELGRC